MPFKSIEDRSRYHHKRMAKHKRLLQRYKTFKG